jgi:hypothetical protein
MSLKTYVPDWLGFDRGREGVLVGPLWKGVLTILAKHEGEDYYNLESPLYEELEQAFPEESWVGETEDRQFFRAYSAAWTLTGVLEKRTNKNPNIKITPLGQAVVSGLVSPRAAILRAAAFHKEKSANGIENPFEVIARAFIQIPNTELSLSDIYFGIECHWREGDIDIKTVIDTAERGKMEATPRRRLRAILKILAELGALKASEDKWSVGSIEVLRAIIDKTTLDEAALKAISSTKISPIAKPLTQAEQAAIANNEFDAKTAEQIRQKVVRSITVRRGQPMFRRNLLTLYSSRCAISQYDSEEALEAAHIIPISEDGNHSPQNGLLLRADLHTLFDLQLIGIDPKSQKVVVGETLKPTLYNNYSGRVATLPLAMLDRPSSVNLQQHLDQLR